MPAPNKIEDRCQDEKTLWQLFTEQGGARPLGECMNLLESGVERLNFDHYPSLWQWPSDELEGFWASTGECFDTISPDSFIALLTRQLLLLGSRSG
ncbi:hypothetical protein FIV41_20510 [Pseudomonas marginalis]|uniref:Uncharacterized protein n=1 Tax=Pseudomonas marginalis TaxID=298 RepID=A0A9X9BR77_PSEMA|nr:hypothetical protein [Pseudomonas marginalis]TWR56173.1 hypothetical protein FIV41_20510 [Pseudomonas marginalis]SEB61536.1 hypothetical protein SAMN04490193_1767 [Pseudomonas marginalis]